MDKLVRQWRSGKFVCVGLELLPKELPMMQIPGKDDQKVYNFFEEIVRNTYDEVAGYTVDLVSLMEFGFKGQWLMEKICHYIKTNHKDIFLVLDVGASKSTKEYADYLYHTCKIDAVTAIPYRGKRQIEHFIRKDKWAFVVCKPSNDKEDDLPFGKDKFNLEIASSVISWNNQGVGLLMGSEIGLLRAVKKMNPEVPIFLDESKWDQEMISSVVRELKEGFIINARDIAYSGRKDYARTCREALKSLNEQIINIISKE